MVSKGKYLLPQLPAEWLLLDHGRVFNHNFGFRMRRSSRGREESSPTGNLLAVPGCANRQNAMNWHNELKL
nr:hypothetical protein Iba_chr01bCG14950 [Ipomoea batatas]